tara:strand:+ start:126 stop:638 length:513 start_codon:yes stop_codon:yes gene_type:complete
MQIKQTFPLTWYALYTKSRHEKFVEAKLLQKGIEAFTPKITLRRRWSDRIKLIENPLFKSYCFARFSLYDKLKTVSQTGVVKIVNFKGQYISIPDETVNSLKILINSQIQLDPCSYIKINDTVAIKRGPLKGVEGIVLDKRNKNTTLVISIDAIESSMQFVVDADCIEAS